MGRVKDGQRTVTGGKTTVTDRQSTVTDRQTGASNQIYFSIDSSSSFPACCLSFYLSFLKQDLALVNPLL